MRYLTGVCVFAALSGAGAVEAQGLVGGWTVRAGYYLGNEFTNGATTGRLEGFAVGVDMPIIRRIPFVGALSLSGDVVLGGSGSSGSDTDGNIYRILLTLRRELGSTPFYAGFGMGYSASDSRGNQFPDTAGFATQYLLGYRFPIGVAGRLQPFLELSFHNGIDGSLSGWSFQAGVRF